MIDATNKELLVFDLDGTLLNDKQRLSDYTVETLALLRANAIPYTLATGRTLHAASGCIANSEFPLLHVYNNGVVIWQPDAPRYLHHNHLAADEIDVVVQAFEQNSVMPMVFAVEEDGSHSAYHSNPSTETCERYIRLVRANERLTLRPVESLHEGAEITNVCTLGDGDRIAAVRDQIGEHEHLAVYTGGDMYKSGFHWMDIHHSASNKGDAINMLKQEMGFERVVCFGDSDNDLSMFEVANEGYAPENALDEIKALANGIVQHHAEDGVAKYLRERYQL